MTNIELCETILDILREDLEPFLPKHNKRGKIRTEPIPAGVFVNWYEDKMKKIKKLARDSERVEQTNFEWLVRSGNLNTFIKKLYFFDTGTAVFNTLIDTFGKYPDLRFDFHDDIPNVIATWLRAKHTEPTQYLERNAVIDAIIQDMEFVDANALATLQRIHDLPTTEIKS